MSDYRIPELPSDEVLGIAGMEEKAEARGGAPPAGGPTAAPDPAPHWRGWVTIAVLLTGGWLSSSYRTLPATRSAAVADTTFASGRAMATVAEIARTPRPTGSPAHGQVRELLVTRLGELGLEPEVQTTTMVRATRETARAVTVRNVLARLPGTDAEAEGAVLLTAHYDAVPGSPGAGDDATGVAVVLETVRALRAGGPLHNDVVVLLTDAEELGLVGARAFVAEHPWVRDVRVVLSVEMRGAGGPSIMFETGSENGWVMARLREADPHPLANSLSTEVYRRLPNDTDFSPFRDAGVQGLNFAAIGRYHRYHSPTDTPENLDEATVQHHGARVLAVARHLAGVPLDSVRAPDRAFTVVPLVGWVGYPVARALPLSLALLGGLLVVTFLASLRGARSRGFLLAALLSALTVGLSAGAGWAMLQWLPPAPHAESLRMLALGAIAFALTTVLFSLGHRWMSPLEATLGALLLPVLALLAATLTAPAAALNLQGPLAATLLLLALLTGVGLHRARGATAWVASLLLALPVLAFLVPVSEFVALALTFRAAPLLGGLFAFCLLYVLPALSGLDHPNRWWAPLGASVVAALLVGLSVLGATPGPDRPVASSLLYVVERSPEGVPTEARWAARVGSGSDWAPTPSGARLADSVRLEGLGIAPGPYWAGPAPLAAVPGPQVSVLSVTARGGTRRVRLGLRSLVGAEVLRLEVPAGVVFEGVSGTTGTGDADPQDGLPGRDPGTGDLTPVVRVLEHWGTPDSLLVVTLSGDADEAWDLTLVEHHLRPGELAGEAAFRRPPGVMAAGGDRALLRTPIRITPVPDSGP
ncbi:MAG: M20/M25/M40 family metallo-hydrolase [Longimicrobiales bacterium]|nr:M20/M25/M40 family metallo-hydrolase [Longimicrobiales bacterium]